MNFKIAVVIVSYNVKEDLLACFSSLEKLSPSGYQLKIFVVDNDSADGSVQAIKSRNIVLLESKVNLGFAGGNNLGIKQALAWEANFVLVLNPDTIVDKSLIKEFLERVKINPKIGIIGPKIYFAPGYEFHKDRYGQKERGKVIWWAGGKMDWNNVVTKHIGVDEVDGNQYNVAGETETIPGTAMFIRREVFEKIGFFNEKYFLYFEETDFCRRAKAAGFKLWYEPKAIIWHKNAQSSGIGSDLQDYYITRNRLLFGFKYAPLRSKFNLLEEAVKLVVSGRPWQKRGVLDFLFGRFGQGSFKK